MLRPMNTIGPSDCTSRSRPSARLVLPEPDSPTMPTVSPLRISTDTPSTAFT